MLRPSLPGLMFSPVFSLAQNDPGGVMGNAPRQLKGNIFVRNFRPGSSATAAMPSEVIHRTSLIMFFGACTAAIRTSSAARAISAPAQHAEICGHDFKTGALL